jgi:hypothetical protein
VDIIVVSGVEMECADPGDELGCSCCGRRDIVSITCSPAIGYGRPQGWCSDPDLESDWSDRAAVE